jgi:hypothetical protein
MPQGWIDIVPPDLWPWLLIATGVVALAVVVLLITLILRQRDPVARRAAHVTPAQQRTLERDVSNLIAALSEMAQEIGTRLDERALRLEKLIDAADERLRRLEQLPDASDIEPPISSPSVVISQPPPLSDEPDGRYAQIYSLADEGLAAVDIAHRLARPKGEVELILALRPRRAG